MNAELKPIAAELVSKAIQEKIKIDLMELFDSGQIEKIETSEQADVAYELVKIIKATIKERQREEKELRAPHKAKDAEIAEFYKCIYLRLSEIESGIRKPLNIYVEEQRRIKELAEKEQERREKEAREAAEKAKNEHEAQAEEAELAAAAAEIAGDGQESTKKRKEAESLREKAESIVEAPRPVSGPLPEIHTPKGFSKQTRYSAEVTDEVKFLTWVFENKEFGLVKINAPALNKMAQAKGKYFNIPGAVLVEKITDVCR